MTAPYSDLASKCEQAALAYAQTVAFGGAVNLYPGESNAALALPALKFVASQSQDEEPQYTGNWWVDFELSIIGAAPVDANNVNPKLEFDYLVAQVIDAFNAANLPALLNGHIPDFTVQGFIPQGPEFQTEGDMWIQKFRWRLLCSPSTL